MITVGAKRRSALHFRCTEVGPHNAGSEAAPLAAGETAYSVRADTLGVQVIAGAHTPVPFRRVPACHSRWPPGAAFRGCHHLPRTTHPDLTR